MRPGRGGVHLVRSNDLVFQSEMKDVHHLIVGRALVGKQVLNCVDVICIPFKFQSLWVALWASKINLILLSEHGSIQ